MCRGWLCRCLHDVIDHGTREGSNALSPQACDQVRRPLFYARENRPQPDELFTIRGRPKQKVVLCPDLVPVVDPETDAEHEIISERLHIVEKENGGAED